MEFTDALTIDHVAMIEAQPVFFVATAASEGRINLSPKGLNETLKVISPERVAYLRNVFDKMVHDPAMIEMAEKRTEGMFNDESWGGGTVSPDSRANCVTRSSMKRSRFA